MYSLVLAMAVSSPVAEESPRRPVRSLISRVVRGPRGGGCSGAQASSGCSGSQAQASGCSGVSRAPVSGCSGETARVSCSGGTASYAIPMPVGQMGSVVPAPMEVGAGPVRRALVHRALVKAIADKERSGELSAADAAKARQVMADPELRSLVASRMERRAGVAAAGDHPFLEWLTQNWREVLTYILSLFGK